MKILCQYAHCGPSFVRKGWGNALTYAGHEFFFWDPQTKSAFDAFRECEPSVYIGTSYDLSRAEHKCIAARPQMKVALFASAWGPYLNDIDLKKYPLVVTTEEEKVRLENLRRETNKPDFVFVHAHDRWLEGTMSGWGELGIPYKGLLNGADLLMYYKGKPRPEFRCDAAFCGGRWSYKSRNIDRFILPLCHPSKGLDVKIFGNQSDWPVAQYLGFIKDEDVKDLFASAKICPNVSEPHSTDAGLSFDIVERPFKILSSGGFVISDFVEEARDLFSEDEIPMAATQSDFFALVDRYLHDEAARKRVSENGRKKVLDKHTYFDRMSSFFGYLGMGRESNHMMAAKATFLEKNPW